MNYSASEINRLAIESSSKTWYFDAFDSGQLAVYRVLLVGGPPHGTKPSSHLTLLSAMAEMPLVDCDEYVVKGVTLLEVPAGTALRNQVGDEKVVGENSYVADVVIQATAGNRFWFDEEDNEAILRQKLAKWGGGFAPVASMLAFETQSNASKDLLVALQVWSQQPNLYYAKVDQGITSQVYYQQQINKGSLGVGFSVGLSDMPSRLVPIEWSSALVEPGEGKSGDGTPSPIPPPPSGKQPAKPTQKNMLVMLAGAIAGYVLFRRIKK